MKIFHVYEPQHFEGLVKNNFLNEDSGRVQILNKKAFDHWSKAFC